jgi:hypothetical protein
VCVRRGKPSTGTKTGPFHRSGSFSMPRALRLTGSTPAFGLGPVFPKALEPAKALYGLPTKGPAPVPSARARGDGAAGPDPAVAWRPCGDHPD